MSDATLKEPWTWPSAIGSLALGLITLGVGGLFFFATVAVLSTWGQERAAQKALDPYCVERGQRAFDVRMGPGKNVWRCVTVEMPK